ncbi:hypothetical protein [Streptomyces sp.]|uniref:hypothetical protein n=1 Tax=Streptomyces sp. TaxID=1931 RepID=UPI002F9309C2
MGAREVETVGLGAVNVTAAQQRAAAVHVADRIAAEHPHPLDDVMPRLAGRQLAADPVIAAGVRELLAALGLLGRPS